MARNELGAEGGLVAVLRKTAEYTAEYDDSADVDAITDRLLAVVSDAHDS